MAKRDSTRDLLASTTTNEPERLTASFYLEDNSEALWICLSGAALKRTGFTPESPLQVRIMASCLVITSD
ncbi:SymE family type I addiction module toxin [Collimonas arenae]|uniref:SymE family type I addiction module toxin n=1 Tax=Collimonas arenae TaxID=279058 RepID=UPI00056EB19D|nr:SymE family type I addiction module toxin [Collimonas arenae]